MAENQEQMMLQPDIAVKEEPKDFTMETSCFGVADCQTNRTDFSMEASDAGTSSSVNPTAHHCSAQEMLLKNSASDVNTGVGNNIVDTCESLPTEKSDTTGIATVGVPLGSNPVDMSALPIPDIESSGLDLSWLSTGDKPPNIADLSFKQFQLLYYQHLFKNMKDVTPAKTKSKPEKRRAGNTQTKVHVPNKAAARSEVKSSQPSTVPASGLTVQVSGDTSSTSNTTSSPKKADVSSDVGATQGLDESNAVNIIPNIALLPLPKPPGYGFTHKCNRCDEMFRSRLELTAHDKRAHPTEWNSDLQCEKCNKKFSSKYYLSQHQLTHKGELPFPCDLCDKRFLCKGTLETHVILLHTDERPHKCDICGAAFKLKKILMRHISTHTKEAPYKCPNCDKCFSRRGSLNRHELIHTGEKPYQCEICEKRFTQKSTLTLHMMGHNNERPHKCSKCDKSFRKKSHLTRHDSVHTGKKRYYECKVCKKCFAEKYCLVEHEKTHQGEPNIASFYLAQRKKEAKANAGMVDYFKGGTEKVDDSKAGVNLTKRDRDEDKQDQDTQENDKSARDEDTQDKDTSNEEQETQDSDKSKQEQDTPNIDVFKQDQDTSDNEMSRQDQDMQDKDMSNNDSPALSDENLLPEDDEGI